MSNNKQQVIQVSKNVSLEFDEVRIAMVSEDKIETLELLCDQALNYERKKPKWHKYKERAAAAAAWSLGMLGNLISISIDGIEQLFTIKAGIVCVLLSIGMGVYLHYSGKSSNEEEFTEMGFINNVNKIIDKLKDIKNKLK